MKNIAIMPNVKKDIGLVWTKKIVDDLKDKAVIYMDKLYEMSGIPAIYTENIYDKIETLIVLGGDGTILQVADECARHGIAVLGVNLGRVGFMSEVEVDDIEAAVQKLLSGEYRIQSRMMLKIEIRQNGSVQGTYYALNDVVIAKSPKARLIYMKLYADGEQVNAYTADGVVIATPTGSTGYSLSAGGPVVDPSMELCVATPICAHMLSARAAVMSPDKELVIRLDDEQNNEAAVSIDGDTQAHIRHGDEVVITKAEYKTRLIKIGNQSFYDTLIRKLS